MVADIARLQQWRKPTRPKSKNFWHKSSRRQTRSRSRSCLTSSWAYKPSQSTRSISLTSSFWRSRRQGFNHTRINHRSWAQLRRREKNSLKSRDRERKNEWIETATIPSTTRSSANSRKRSSSESWNYSSKSWPGDRPSDSTCSSRISKSKEWSKTSC